MEAAEEEAANGREDKERLNVASRFLGKLQPAGRKIPTPVCVYGKMNRGVYELAR